MEAVNAKEDTQKKKKSWNFLALPRHTSRKSKSTETLKTKAKQNASGTKDIPSSQTIPLSSQSDSSISLDEPHVGDPFKGNRGPRSQPFFDDTLDRLCNDAKRKMLLIIDEFQSSFLNVKNELLTKEHRDVTFQESQCMYTSTSTEELYSDVSFAVEKARKFVENLFDTSNSSRVVFDLEAADAYNTAVWKGVNAPVGCSILELLEARMRKQLNERRQHMAIEVALLTRQLNTIREKILNVVESGFNLNPSLELPVAFLNVINKRCREQLRFPPISVFSDAVQYILDESRSIKNGHMSLISKEEDFKVLESHLKGQWGSFALFERWIQDSTRWQCIDIYARKLYIEEKDSLVEIVRYKMEDFTKHLDIRLSELWIGCVSAFQRDNLLIWNSTAERTMDGVEKDILFGCSLWCNRLQMEKQDYKDQLIRLQGLEGKKRGEEYDAKKRSAPLTQQAGLSSSFDIERESRVNFTHKENIKNLPQPGGPVKTTDHGLLTKNHKLTQKRYDAEITQVEKRIIDVSRQGKDFKAQYEAEQEKKRKLDELKSLLVMEEKNVDNLRMECERLVQEKLRRSQEYEVMKAKYKMLKHEANRLASSVKKQIHDEHKYSTVKLREQVICTVEELQNQLKSTKVHPQEEDPPFVPTDTSKYSDTRSCSDVSAPLTETDASLYSDLPRKKKQASSILKTLGHAMHFGSRKKSSKLNNQLLVKKLLNRKLGATPNNKEPVSEKNIHRATDSDKAGSIDTNAKQFVEKTQHTASSVIRNDSRVNCSDDAVEPVSSSDMKEGTAQAELDNSSMRYIEDAKSEGCIIPRSSSADTLSEVTVSSMSNTTLDDSTPSRDAVSSSDSVRSVAMRINVIPPPESSTCGKDTDKQKHSELSTEQRSVDNGLVLWKDTEMARKLHHAKVVDAHHIFFFTLFSNVVTMDAIPSIRDYVSFVHLPATTAIFSPTETVGEMYVVNTGKVEVSDAKGSRLEVLTQGSPILSREFVAGSIANVHVVSKTDVALTKLGYHCYRRLLEEFKKKMSMEIQDIYRADSSPFANVPIDKLEKLVQHTNVVYYFPGEVIRCSSDPHEHHNIYVVLKGYCTVGHSERFASYSSKKNKKKVEKGQFFGLKVLGSSTFKEKVTVESPDGTSLGVIPVELVKQVVPESANVNWDTHLSQHPDSNSLSEVQHHKHTKKFKISKSLSMILARQNHPRH